MDKSTEIEFDPLEWKMFMPGVFYNRLKPDMFCFRCEEKEEKEEKEKVEPVKLTKKMVDLSTPHGVMVPVLTGCKNKS